MTNKIIVGTRDSKLALTQANKVITKLNSIYPDLEFKTLKVKTKAVSYTHLTLPTKA